ncbi:hypothetical protein [Acidicapsa acidisoli]|uniref:hypothetical protein n=1 Tax=Acidicapsa acidisoli TaxID=1615681 RepID=UPI0021DF553F|nr:hypothetical protein [Acidicapsa acidisoli]
MVTVSVDPLDTTPEQELVHRILTSKHFNKAPLLSEFLAYVCRRALGDGADRISEQEIGVSVFGRKHGYNSKEDNIVRNYARQLRRRLEEYYLTDGRDETLRIEIPKGGYLPAFVSIQGATDAEPMDGESLPDEDQEQPPRIFSSRSPGLKRAGAATMAMIVCSLLVGVAAGAAGIWAWQHFKSPASHVSEMHLLWAQLFRPDQDTFIVPADTGFVMLQEIKGKSYSLAEYASWSSVKQPEPSFIADLKNRKYTSVMDIETVVQLERLPELIQDRCLIRNARSLTLEDLGERNMILLGSVYSIPWIELFQKNLNFQFVYRPGENRAWIENRHPASGEAATYANNWNGLSEKAYAVIAFLPNLNKTGHVLLVQGLDGAGTDAAVNLLFHTGDLNGVIDRVRHADGTLGSFEVLLESTSVNSHATNIRIVSVREPR